MDAYIVKLEDELNKLKQEKIQLETLGRNNQKVIQYSLHQFFHSLILMKVEELETKLREETAKVTLLQGQVDEAEARATADQETILDELNVAAEKETELANKTKRLEEDLRKERLTIQEMQGKAVLSQKQIALLEENVKGKLSVNLLNLRH